MSESYEGIVFRSSYEVALSTFRDLPTPIRLRLVRLSDGTFGIYRPAERDDQFDSDAISSLAAGLSKTSLALAVLYDNRCGLRVAAAFREGVSFAEFGAEDELWVPLDDDGVPRRDIPPVTATQLDQDVAYDCVRDAIALGLSAIGAPAEVTSGTLKDAFCYERSAILAESG